MTKRAIILVLLSLCLVFTACAEPAAVDAADVFGTVEGDTYENTLLGIGCKLEGWHYNNEEEMAALNNMTKGMVGEEVAKLLDQAAPFQAMMAMEGAGARNVNIQLQNMSANQAMIEAVGLKMVAEASVPQFKATLESAGFTEVDVSAGEVTVDGETLNAIVGSYKIQGIQVFFKQPWIFKDGYLGNITVSSAQTDTTDEILGYFYLMK